MPRKMKESGVEWLGQIPEGWGLGRIGALYSLRNEKVSDKDFPPLSVTMKGIVPQLETAAKTDDGDNRKLVRKGDFAINSRSDRRGSCGISAYDGSVSLINTILTPRGAMSPAYYNWLFHTTSFADEFYKWGHGIVDDLWTTRWDDMKRIAIPTPPYSEQERIAAFLDERCAKIDGMIAEAKASIEDYKKWKQSIIFEAVTGKHEKNLKPSGVDWIGDVPEGWKVCRIVNLYSEVSERGNDELPILSVSINTGVSDKELSEEEQERVFLRSEDRTKYKRVQPGDLTYNMMRAWQGAFGAVRVDGMVSPAYVVARPKVDMDSRYVEYLLRTPNATEEMKRFSHGITDFRLRLYWPEFKDIKIPCPNVKEQKQIADYIDEKCAAIDKLVGEKESLIADLEAYKKSLIFETVTGKREVA